MMGIGWNLGDQLPTIDAGRVRLRWLTQADVPALFEIFGDAEVTRFWGFGTLPDLAAASALLNDIQNQFRAQTLFQWGVELKAKPEPEIIGTCTFSSICLENRRAELGFALGRRHWGCGFMAAALPPLLDFAFDTLNFHRLVADSDPRNLGSIRLLERLGFRLEGCLREHYLVAGEPQDALVFGLLRSDWKPENRSGTLRSPGV